MCEAKARGEDSSSVHVQLSITGWKQHQKGQKTTRGSVIGLKGTHGQTNQLDRISRRGSKRLKENDVRIVIQSVWRQEEAGNQEEKRVLLRWREGMVVEQWRMSAKEDRVQRSLRDERAKHASGQKKASEAEAQHLRILNNWIWKKTLGPLHEGPHFEAPLRILNIHWGQTSEWRSGGELHDLMCVFLVLHTKTCPAFLSNIQCQSIEKLILKVRGKNKATAILYRGEEEAEKYNWQTISKAEKPHRFISFVLIVSVIIK